MPTSSPFASFTGCVSSRRSPDSPAFDGKVADSGPRDCRLASVSSASLRSGCSAEAARRALRRHWHPAPACASPDSRTAASVRPDDRDRVLEVLDRRLEVRHLAGHLRPVRRDLRAHGVEERAELAELVLAEIELDAQLALSQPRQAAADDMNGPQQQLREERRPEDRHRQRDQRGERGRSERSIQIAPNQQRRHADANRPELADRRAAAAACNSRLRPSSR